MVLVFGYDPNFTDSTHMCFFTLIQITKICSFESKTNTDKQQPSKGQIVATSLKTAKEEETFMTGLETMQHAKMYIDKLATGINMLKV